MIASPAISVRDVSKHFILGGRPIASLTRALFRSGVSAADFTALRGVSFDVSPGETLGLIGRNGSGKSTLLQVICGVLRPDAGVVAVRGRIAALLELGTGFNPEFTGRQNVFISGALAGYSSDEMTRRMKSIESFAEIGSFMDQPVRTYSSGMFLRLAFSAAINVDPDVLVIDEALAVGDARFQHKCFEKFRELQRGGKTIIFVTHDMQQIARLCDRAALMEQGSLIKMGSPTDVIHSYHNLVVSGSLSPQGPRSSQPERPVDDDALEGFLSSSADADRCVQRPQFNKGEYRYGDKRAEIVDFALVSEGRWQPAAVYTGDRLDLYVKARFHMDVARPLFGFAIKTVDGVYVYGTNTRFENFPVTARAAGDATIFKVSIKIGLAAGDYFLDLGIGEQFPNSDGPADVREAVVHLSVHSRTRFDGLVRMDTTLEEIRPAPASASAAR